MKTHRQGSHKAQATTQRRREKERGLRALVAACLLSVLLPVGVRADLGPGVKIRMPRESATPARSGEEMAGVIEILVGREGTLSIFEFVGRGWEIRSVHAAVVH